MYTITLTYILSLTKLYVHRRKLAISGNFKNVPKNCVIHSPAKYINEMISLNSKIQYIHA